jgi:glyoxylase-like metal-dependent hydrolase (beta-lactamase superfamily II)
VSDRLYEILGGRGARGAAYVGDNGILIVDSKMDKQSVDQVITGVRQISQKPIRYLVNTHSDGDHILGNQYFPETVTIVAHENCRKEFFHPGRDGTPSEWENPELAPFVPSLTFRDKMDLYLGSRKVEFWYFGVGHTTGDAVVYIPEEKAAFLGDQIFLSRPQLIHAYKGGNSFEYVKTVTKMLETIDAEKFFSGHSGATNREAITNHVERVRRLQERLKALVEKGVSLAETKSEFAEDEARLVEVIYREVEESNRE